MQRRVVMTSFNRRVLSLSGFLALAAVITSAAVPPASAMVFSLGPTPAMSRPLDDSALLLATIRMGPSCTYVRDQSGGYTRACCYRVVRAFFSGYWTCVRTIP